MMIDKSPYRCTAAMLLVLFVVFSVGLPVVVYSCPMAKDMTACNACSDGPGSGESVSAQFDRSCCATVLLAERNTTEFIQTAKVAPPILEALVIISAAPLPDHEPVAQILTFRETSRGSPEHLPILHSSLLL